MRLNSTITLIVYIIVSATLQAVIDMIKWYKVEFMMTQPKISNYAKTKISG